jgi:tetratricopeptide (TPR) repeat protein
MAETSVAALDPRLQKQVESARVAYGRGNFDYTATLCRSILKETPNCVSVRRLHRTALLRLHHGSGSPFAATVGVMSNAPFVLKPGVEPDREPLVAVENSEEMLESDPNSVDALRLLGVAAAALGWRETAIFAYESIGEKFPRDVGNLVELGEAQLAAGHAAKAIEAAERALHVDSSNDRAYALLKSAAGAQAVKVGRGEENGGLRNSVRV